jgi:hypothetical protein
MLTRPDIIPAVDPRQGWLSAYRLIWAGAALAVVALVAWLVSRDPGSAYEHAVPGELKSSVEKVKPRELSIDESASALQAELGDAEISVRSSDGKVKMRLWADEARKSAGHYTLKEGALQFDMSDGGVDNSVVLRVSDATYRREAGVVRVSGSLVGHVIGGNHYFAAEELYWDQSEARISARRVHYVGPALDVSGDSMSIDLATGQVDFTGPVEAGF